ncbi:ABC transporter ATP-binding protein [Rhodococcus sp. NPDC058521]|uniref:ABC transporter ATP-binding protein n=1 Tax=Rhodococcus sp. NPDC058521 TaxID=3346536 RepID=UPI00365222F0
MPTTAEPVIDVRELEKNYGRFRALSGLDLSVGQGEVHGFLGPNGAGKSTTIRILLGLLRRDGGTARVFGLDPWRDSLTINKRLAYVPGDVNLWPSLTGGEVIDVLCRLRGGVDRRRRDELVERFELDPGKKGATYSKGNRQKVALVAAFASDPDLLVLDEPTSGLDPLMENVFTELVAESSMRGSTVLLSSHILSEVEKLCSTVSIVRDGRTVQSGSLDSLRALARTGVDVTTARPITGLAALPGVHDVVTADGPHNRVTFTVDTDNLDLAMESVAAHGITALSSSPPRLEALFLDHYTRDLEAAVR